MMTWFWWLLTAVGVVTWLILGWKGYAIESRALWARKKKTPALTFLIVCLVFGAFSYAIGCADHKEFRVKPKAESNKLPPLPVRYMRYAWLWLQERWEAMHAAIMKWLRKRTGADI